MEFFTKKGVKQVQAKFQKLIEQDFYFDDSERKQKLIAINKQECGHIAGGFYIIFQSDNISLTIDKFFNLNDITYNFYDFEIIAIDK